jgi:hypothetical protein
MAGGDHVGNPDAAEHYYDDKLGFKRVLNYGADQNGTAQPLSLRDDGTVVIFDERIASLLKSINEQQRLTNELLQAIASE